MNGRLLESTLRQISSEQYEIEQITGNNSLLGEIRLKIRQFLSNFPLSKTFPSTMQKACQHQSIGRDGLLWLLLGGMVLHADV